MSPDSKKHLSDIVKISAVVLVVSLGIWGCARKPNNPSSNDRVRSLEGRCVKLEQDYRTVAQARDKARKDLSLLEEEAARLQRESADRQELLKERDELRRQAAENAKQLTRRTAERDQLTRDLNVKTAERDTLLGRYDRLRNSLQAIMVEDEGMPRNQPMPPAAATSAGPALKSDS